MSDTGKTIALIKALGGGGGLPPVTASDAGKVLSVDNSGVWGAQNPVSFENDFTAFKYYIKIDSLDQDPSFVGDDDREITGNEVYRDIIRGKAISAKVLVKDGPLYVLEGIVTLFPATLAWTDNQSVNNGHGYGLIRLATMLDTDNGIASYIQVTCANTDETEDDVTFGAASFMYGQNSKFIVTLTPTSADYSGTMDKTVAEIDAAYKAGREIVFMIDNGYGGLSFTVTQIETGIDEYPSFHAFGIFTEMFIEAYNEYTDSEHGTSTEYSTAIYTLTPAT